MPISRVRSIHRLSQSKIVQLKEPGKYEDGGGLRLIIGPNGSKRWVLRVSINGKRRERGLGSFSLVGLERAREKAIEIRAAARCGVDLVKEQRNKKRLTETTFRDSFNTYFEIKKQSLSNAKHLKQWTSTMETYVFPIIGDRAVSEIEALDILEILTPIWFEKPETARRILQRMEAVFKSSILRGNRTQISPCIGVAEELGPRVTKIKHHASLPWQKVPEFVKELRQRQASISAKLGFEFLILTASRSGELRGARWSEIDYQGMEWKIPAERMKGRRAHIVPLSDRCIQILDEVQTTIQSDQFIFPGQSNKMLSDATFNKLIREMGYKGRATAHGFRSSFKIWASENQKVRDEVSEAALAHQIRDKVRAAYLRTDFLEERRILMAEWTQFITNEN